MAHQINTSALVTERVAMKAQATAAEAVMRSITDHTDPEWLDAHRRKMAADRRLRDIKAVFRQRDADKHQGVGIGHADATQWETLRRLAIAARRWVRDDDPDDAAAEDALHDAVVAVERCVPPDFWTVRGPRAR